jgi:hypothetical protein
MNNLKVLAALIGVGLVGCSSFESNLYSKNTDHSKILPSYVSADNKGISADAVDFVEQLDDADLMVTNSAPVLSITESNTVSSWKINNNFDARKSLNLPVLDVNYQNSDLAYYPLLNANLQLLIPARITPTPAESSLNYLYSPVGLNPSQYNLRELQPDNLQAALLNSAFLNAHKMLVAHLDPDIVKTRLEYLDVAKTSLETMYSNDATLRPKFESAVAFGVFEIKNFNVLLYVAAYGKGVIFDNKNKQVIYMDTVRSGTGPGLGYESLYLVFVFKNEMALSQFIGAKGGGGDIGASATLGVLGEQISFNPEIAVYQLYKNGFDLQANWGGTVYFPAPSLND